MNFLTTNLHGKSTRIEEHEGKEYLVSPVVMLKEGVHAGSNGPLFYDARDLESSAASWNGMPVVVNHPSVNGYSVSVNDLPQSARKQVGTIKNAKWERGKLKADAWLDVEQMTALLPEFVDPLLNDGGVLEVSTGLFTDNEYFQGHFEGKDFQYVARNHRPDHLALLPGQVGACSIADGCGLNVNQSNGLHHFNNKEHKIMDIHVTGHPLFARQGAPVMNHGTGDRDDFLPLPTMDFGPPAEPTNNCGCGAKAGHRETEADIDREFNRRLAIAESVSLTTNGTRETLPRPTMNFGSPAGHGGKPTVNNGDVIHNGPGLPLPVMVF